MTVALRVRCEGEWHRLELLDDGTLRMLDHNEKTLRAFAAFQAEKPRCLKVVHTWYYHPLSILFSSRNRWMFNNDKAVALPSVPLVYLAHDFVKHAVESIDAPELLPSLDALRNAVARYDPSSVLPPFDPDLQSEVARRLQPLGTSASGFIGRAMISAIRALVELRSPFPYPEHVLHHTRLAARDARAAVAAASAVATEFGVMDIDEEPWQVQRAAAVLNRYARGEPWQPV